MPDPKPIDPLTRYREIERAAKAACPDWLPNSLEDIPEYIKSDPVSVAVWLFRLRPVLESTPNPDIALVPVRRIRTEEGEPTCTCCPLLCSKFEDSGEYEGAYFAGVGCELLEVMVDDSRVPHPDCPVWREEK